MIKYAVIFILLLFTSKEVFCSEPCDIVKITEKEFLTGIALNEKLEQAARTGIFYLEIPSNCKSLIQNTVDFANSFYTKDSIKELNLKGFSGYQDRNFSQVEAFYLEHEYWKEHLPEELYILARETYSVAIQVIKKTLPLCGISQDDFGKITGKVTEGGGDVFFTFNHYRPEINYEGLAAHRDFGQITILFINQPGLQAKINEEWVDVNPINGYFIVNFGKALERSINDLQQLTAVWHRVEHVKEDRVSFAICIGNAGDSFVYKKTQSGQVITEGEPYLNTLKASSRYTEKFQSVSNE